MTLPTVLPGPGICEAVEEVDIVVLLRSVLTRQEHGQLRALARRKQDEVPYLGGHDPPLVCKPALRTPLTLQFRCVVMLSSPGKHIDTSWSDESGLWHPNPALIPAPWTANCSCCAVSDKAIRGETIPNSQPEA